MSNASRLKQSLALSGIALLSCLSAAAQSQDEASGKHSVASEAANPHDFSGGGRPHHLPWRHPDEQKAIADRAKFQAAAKTNAHNLSYFGGPVVSNVKVVKVNYGAGTYQPFVSGTGAGTMTAFYKGILGSSYFTWLNADYKTPTQSIGTGTYGGDISISPQCGQ